MTVNAIGALSWPLKYFCPSESTRVTNQKEIITFKHTENQGTSEKTDSKTENQKFINHTVKEKENVWNIAKHYLKERNGGKEPTNAEILEFTKEIKELNKLEYDNDRNPQNYYITIYPGDVLKIPAPEYKKEDATPKPLSETEIEDAQATGKSLADNLTNWYTTKDDQKSIKTMIEQRVNDRNVLEVLKSYEDKKRFTGDSFFEQMRTEWDFDEKHALIKNVAEKLQAYLTANGQTEWAKQIADLKLADKDEISKDDATVLDGIVKNCLGTEK
jgi:hypothetical protein